VITNVDLKEHKDLLFAHTGALRIPEMFAGRQEEKEELLQEMEEAQEGSVLVVSEPLGAGKTTFLNMGLGGLEDRGLVHDRRDVMRSVRKVDDESIDDLGENRVLIVDELDRKVRRDRLLDRLSLLNARLGHDVPHLILAGDQAISDDDEVREVLGSATTMQWLGLHALSCSLLIEALRARADYYPSSQHLTDGVPELFDERFLDRLIPRTEPRVATFREVLSVLAGIANSNSAVPLDKRPCVFSGEVCGAWFNELPPVTEDPAQVHFLVWLSDFIEVAEGRDEPIRAFSTEEWLELCPIPKIDGAQQYEELVLDPLARANVLRGFGVPYRGGVGRSLRDPGPYLPTVMTFLRSAFDPAWP